MLPDFDVVLFSIHYFSDGGTAEYIYSTKTGPVCYKIYIGWYFFLGFSRLK